MFSLIAAMVLTLVLFALLKERVLYLIFIWAYIQNFVLAWMYTSGWAGTNLCQALLVIKEFLLLWLFFYFLPQLKRCCGGRWPLPLRILGLFTLWCTVRYLAAVLLQGQGFVENLWYLRVASFPLQILTVAIGLSLTKPKFANRFIRQMSYVTAGMALLGILIYLIPETTFWRNHVDIADYNLEVKGGAGDSALREQLGGEDEKEIEEGLPGNARGHEEFAFLSAFRAFGTVGDAVGFGHLLAFPVLLLTFCFPRNWKTNLMLGVTLVALFFSFTRSAWIFVLVGYAIALFRKKRYRLILGVVGTVVIALMIWTPLVDWYSNSLAMLSWDNPQEDHAEGLVWLYREGLWQRGNVFGQGLTAHVPESGYGLLLVRYGMPAFLCILWFCWALYRSLRQSAWGDRSLFLVAQVVPLGMIVMLNFSYYPFSFIPYLLTWFVVGTCLALVPAKGEHIGELT